MKASSTDKQERRKIHLRHWEVTPSGNKWVRFGASTQRTMSGHVMDLTRTGNNLRFEKDKTTPFYEEFSKSHDP